MKRRGFLAIVMAAAIMTVVSGCGKTAGAVPAQATVEEQAAEEAAEKEAAEKEAAEKAAAEEAAAKEAEAEGYYEDGRAYLYGLNEKEINLESAHTNFEKALELGKTDANFYLGAMLNWYNYPQHDDEKAKTYYEANSDNPYAQIGLGLLYQKGTGVEKDLAKAQELFQTAVDQGCVEGYLGLAGISYGEKEYEAAFENYNKVLEGTEPIYIGAANDYIGSMYYDGEGVEQNNAKAKEWYEKGVELGNTDAMNQIGSMYYNGYGVEQDYVKAMEWSKKGADLGNATSMYNMGWMYQSGYGTEQDYAKAMEWYEKAADLGDTDAMIQIAAMHYNGEGAEQDNAKAMEWYEKAADLGDVNAMGTIGDMYYNGEGAEQDYAKAMEWYEKAADLGGAGAMNQIGIAYYEGKAVEQDYAKAVEWFEKAAKLGNETAAGNAEAVKEMMQ